MQVIFIGGASGVGASCVAIELAHQWIVVDAGIRMDRNADPLPDLAVLQDKPVRAVFITHAHADHIGALPLLHQAFPHVPMYTSRATSTLMEVMLADALHIMERRAAEEMELPLYPPSLVAGLLSRVRPLPIGETVTVPELPEITIHTSRAGHIAGAMSLGFVCSEGSVVVSGDISVTPQRTVLGAQPPACPHPDLLILESTYGARLHPNRQAEEERLALAVAEGIAGGGHVLIPCFGLGRGQEVLLLLQAAQEQGLVPPFPIVVDGLIRKVCSAYSLVPEALTPRLARQLRKGFQPFEGPNVTFLRDGRERERILAGPPTCILASSGMLTGGPSAWYAARLTVDPHASILITGYQDEESPGRRLLDLAEGKQNTLELDGRVVTVACHVAKYSLSAHADGSELAAYAAHLHPRQVALVHGDPEARQALRTLLEGTDVLLPQNGTALKLNGRAPAGARKKAAGPVVRALPSDIGGGALFTAVDVKTLWRALVHLPILQVMTLRELVTVWYGDSALPEQAQWMEDVLEEEQPYDEPYFIRHPEIPEAYHIRSPEPEEREEELGHLVGQILLLRLEPVSAKPVLCRAIEAHETIRIRHPRGEHNERTRFSLRWMLDVIGPLPYAEDRSEVEVLTEVTRTARRIRKRLSAHDLARTCKEDGAYTLSDLCTHVGLPVHDLASRAAVAKLLQQHPRLFVQKTPPLEEGRYARYGLSPQWQEALQEPEIRERPDQSWILSVIEQHLGSPADLVRRSIDTDTGDVTLAFFFPEVAEERYSEVIAAAAEEAGVNISIASHTHQGALAVAAKRHLPAGLRLMGQPSIFLEQCIVQLNAEGAATEEELTEAQDTFYDETHWYLEIAIREIPAHKSKQAEILARPTATRVAPLSQQEALARAWALLSPLPGYQKVGAELARRILRVRFDFPDAAQERYKEQFAQLTEETGWQVEIHPRVHQEALISLAQQLLPPELQVVGKTSLHQGHQLLILSYTGDLSPEAEKELQQRFTDETGWTLQLREVM